MVIGVVSSIAVNTPAPPDAVNDEHPLSAAIPASSATRAVMGHALPWVMSCTPAFQA
jgi:hypothetical protein